MHDNMTDLETWGTRPGCAIRSIGSVMFDPYDKPGTVGEQFYANVALDDQKKMGLKVSEDTEKWWTGPKMAEANKMLLEDQKPVKLVVRDFIEFWHDTGARRFWSQGGNFDDPILTAVIEACGAKPPWKFWDGRCTRTAYAIGNLNFNAQKRVGVAHHALHDAVHQAKCVQMAHANLKEK